MHLKGDATDATFLVSARHHIKVGCAAPETSDGGGARFCLRHNLVAYSASNSHRLFIDLRKNFTLWVISMSGHAILSCYTRSAVLFLLAPC